MSSTQPFCSHITAFLRRKAGRSGSTLLAALAAVLLAVFGGAAARAQQVVISQIYGGSNSATGPSTYNRDFVELHNRGSSAVALSTWSIQYASATGTSWAARTLSGSIAADGYYLIQMTTSGTIGAAIPTPDHVVATTNDMSASTGKLALVAATTALPAQSCFEVGTNGIVDFVGYGQAALPTITSINCYEGSAATGPVLSTIMAAFRNNSGCTDTQDNALDFTNATPAPRNSASPTFACTATGACCSGTSCSYTTSAACTGTYQGDFTYCGTVSYPAPTSPATAFEDISGTGTLITTLDNSDDGTAAFSFTPTFTYFGKTRNIVSVGVNGLLSFLPGTSASSFSPVAIPAVATPNDFIAPMWMDMFMRTTLTGGHAYIQALAGPDRLVVQWKNVSTRTSSTLTPDMMNFEVILFLDGTGNFDIRYGAMTTTATTPAYAAVTGCENQSGTIGTSYAGGSFAALAGTDRHFTPAGNSVCAPPVNDTCASATIIGSGGTGTGGIGGNSGLATLDGPAMGCGVPVDSDVWYSFTPSSSCYTWDLSTCTGTAFDTVIEVYDACGGLLVGCNDNDGTCGSGLQSRINALALSTSTTYLIRVAKNGFPSAGGVFTLVVVPTTPGNDVCGLNMASYTIPCAGGTVCGNLSVANAEGNADASCMSATNPGLKRDLFYYFTPCNPCATGWTFSTCGGTNVDTTVSVLSACPTAGANNQFSAADCFDEGCGAGNLSFGTATDLVDGNSYIIRVGMWSSTATPGPFTLTVTPVISSANDVCAGAIALTSGVPAAGSTACATFDTAGSCDLTGKDVWYKFTAPAAAGTYTLTTCGSAIDTAITVFSSCGGGELACDDNSAACGGGAAQVVLAMSASQSIVIRVSDLGGVGGAFVLTNDYVVPPPANDECVAATVISGSGAFAYDNTYATPATATAPSSACQALQSKDIWYSWTSEGPGSMTIDTCGGPTWDSVITLYTGACGSLTEVACDDDTCVTPSLGSLLTYTVSACTQYTIRISSYNATIGIAGSFNLAAPGPIDTDGDTVTDCLDGCPMDAGKTSPGVCGCGMPDVDTDGDTVLDCLDGCPMDANKTAPGICGCGFSDTLDTDGDTVIDCLDGCPMDANKTAPGICGCGFSDTLDSDGDTVIDCLDGCPMDGTKTAPGQCGCGTPDTDTDGDTVADCVDGCPMDGTKTSPGQCGCGNPDTDTDGDTVADCVDGCPMDGTKTSPGQCGCGNPDTDTDGDGIADCNDNCDSIANPLQEDCDFDGDGDVCEIFNCTATDLDNNGVPDNCQPGAILVYCTSGTSVNGCSPSISTFGTPSASQPNGFYVATFGNDGDRNGQFFYGLCNQATPFAAGFMCVTAPRQRMGAPFLTGGNPGSCNGALFIDVNVFATNHPGSLGVPLTTGLTYCFEGYNRDPSSPGALVMSNAVGVTFLP